MSSEKFWELSTCTICGDFSWSKCFARKSARKRRWRPQGRRYKKYFADIIFWRTRGLDAKDFTGLKRTGCKNQSCNHGRRRHDYRRQRHASVAAGRLGDRDQDFRRARWARYDAGSHGGIAHGSDYGAGKRRAAAADERDGRGICVRKAAAENCRV